MVWVLTKTSVSHIALIDGTVFYGPFMFQELKLLEADNTRLKQNLSDLEHEYARLKQVLLQSQSGVESDSPQASVQDSSVHHKTPFNSKND